MLLLANRTYIGLPKEGSKFEPRTKKSYSFHYMWNRSDQADVFIEEPLAKFGGVPKAGTHA